MSDTVNWGYIEGPIKGEMRVNRVEAKDGKPDRLVVNLGFPIDTTWGEGVTEHNSFWSQVVVFGGLAEIVSKLPLGFRLYCEGHYQGNFWKGKDGIVRGSQHLIVERAGERQGGSKEVKYFVVPVEHREARRKKGNNGAKPPVRLEDAFDTSKLTKEQIREAAQRYLDEHDQAENEPAGPGVANADGSAQPESVGPGGAG